MNTLATILLFSVIYLTSAQDGPIVNTNYGRIRGYVEKSSGGKDFYTFNNIPFAKPPTGLLRFMKPEQPESWSGIRNGTTVHPSCTQPNLALYVRYAAKVYEGEEDCLYLSVYTPKIEAKLLPVLVYIHGGGFFAGAGTSYTGQHIVTKDAILVSINYRLGPLGFLSTEDDVMPGNLGLWDQTMALKWIQENIKKFGGDPNRVTIFGNSAGGASVHFHIFSPYSKGLFKRAVIMGGNALCPWTHTKAVKAIAHQLGGAVGCFTATGEGKAQSQRLKECLQKVGEKELTMTFDGFMDWTWLPMNFSPYVDRVFIPDEPEVLLREGRYNKVDIMIGITANEGACITNGLYGPNDYLEKLQNNFEYYGHISLGLSYDDYSSEISKKVYDYYLNKHIVGVQDVEIVNEMFSDRHFRVCTDVSAKMHSKHLNKVYMYEYEHRGQRSFGDLYEREFGKNWVAHMDELISLFPIQLLRGTTDNENDMKMVDIMTGIWTNFARTGDPAPNNSLGFTWNSFNEDSQKYLAINLQSEMRTNSRQKINKFWSTLPLEENKLLYGEQLTARDNSEL